MIPPNYYLFKADYNCINIATNNQQHTTNMSASILSNQAMEALMTKFPGLDESQLKEIAGAVFEAVPQQKTQRKVKEIPAEERCMTHVAQDTYDEAGNYIYGKPGQCMCVAKMVLYSVLSMQKLPPLIPSHFSSLTMAPMANSSAMGSSLTVSTNHFLSTMSKVTL